jgi:ferredoxin-NADP reductase
MNASQGRSGQLTQVEVVRRDNAAEGVVTLELAPADGGRLPPWRPGAHIDVLLAAGLERQYSLCGNPGDDQLWRIAVLREPNGRGGSQYIHDRVQAGHTLTTRGPRNHFSLVSAPRYKFIAGGIGITPILPMAKAAEAASAEWSLLYGGRRLASMAFREELTAYGERCRFWPEDERGLLPLADELSEPPAGTLVYCCGPGVLLDAVEKTCERWPLGTLHVERFRARTLTKPALEGSFEVECAVSGLIVQVAPDQSILEALTDAGLDLDSSCLEGACGTCEVSVLEGTPDHRDSILEPGEKAANDVMMICVSRSKSSCSTSDNYQQASTGGNHDDIHYDDQRPAGLVA